jgi:hypothetical protein
VVTGLVLIGGSALAWLGLPSSQRRSDRPAAASHREVAAPGASAIAEAARGSATTLDLLRLRARRTDLFEELVRVEKDHAAGLVADDERRERHEALVTQLAELDGQIEDSRLL